MNSDMNSKVSSLDQQYIEALKLRNELIKRFNASLEANINDVQGRVLPGNCHTTTSKPATVQDPLESPGETKLAEPNSDVPINASVSRGDKHVNPNAQDESNVNEAIPEKKRFRVVVNKWNSNTQKWEDLEDKPTQNSDLNDRHIVYRRLMDSENERKCHDEECIIPLPRLRYLLRDTMMHVERDWFETESIGFDSPFTNIIYNWDTLEEASQPQQTDGEDTQECRNNLKLLLDNIRISEPRKLKTYFKDRDSHQRAKTITFGTLWTLFQPGTKVLAKPFMDEWQVFEVQTNWCYLNPPGQEVPDDSAGYDQYRYFQLYCAGLDWDGRHFRRYTYPFKFEKFEGRRVINGLQCFPIKYWSAENARGMQFDKLQEQLINRGKKFAKLCTVKKEDYLCKYGGFLLHGLPPRVSSHSPSNKQYGYC
jgi:hypothetical protein